ncbi:MAG: nitrite reductase, copper-containing [Proteobacteria bacterium]|nr:nitrite reductase, copper-containing [Pseudomonadota bacterium]
MRKLHHPNVGQPNVGQTNVRGRSLPALGIVAAAITIFFGPLAHTGPAAGQVQAAEINNLPRVTQELVAPPFVPKHEQVATAGPRIVEVRLVIEEKTMVIDEDGTVIQAMTFNGSVPGPLIVVHEGDYVELTLVNPEANAFEHNIDFHAATGALGGAALSHVFPGEEVVIRWKATKAGVFVYHCAPGGSMIPWHVVSGMNGAIMVLPRDGLTDRDGNALRYDRAYYIGEQDFYIPRDEDGQFKIYEDPLVATRYFFLGPGQQNQTIFEGYDKKAEDRLLQEIGWPNDGYRLFDISCPAGSSANGWFLPFSESNCLTVSRSMFDALGGFASALERLRKAEGERDEATAKMDKLLAELGYGR